MMRKCFMTIAGVLVCGVVVYAVPNVQHSPLGPREVAEAVDPNTPVMYTFDDATLQRGGVAAVPLVGAPVYLLSDSCLFGNFSQDDDTLGLGTWSAQARFTCPPGYPLCREGGWQAGDAIAGYEVKHFFVSSASANAVSVEVELWDGDPLWAFDTVCVDHFFCVDGADDGDPCDYEDPTACPDGICTPMAGPIAGTKATFTDLAPATRHFLKAQLPAPVTYGCDRVWIVVTQIEGCRASWTFGGTSTGSSSTCQIFHPDIGWGDGYINTWGCQQYGLCPPATAYYTIYGTGTCCTDDSVCDYHPLCTGDPLVCDSGPNVGLTCAANSDCWVGDCGGGGHPTYCSDGVIDYYFAYYDEAPEYYNASPAAVYAATDLTMSWQPVSAGAPPSATAGVGYTIVGNEIKLESGGVPVWMEIRISDVDLLNGDGTPDPPDNLQLIKAWQCNLTTAGFTAGILGMLTVYSPACTTRDDCIALQGPLGNPWNIAPGDCGPIGWPANTCIPAFIDGARTDYMFYMLSESGAIDVSTPDFRYGATTTAVIAPDFETYAGTLTLELSADAKGTFYVGIDPLGSVVSDGQNVPLPMMGFVPGIITVVVGKCCYDIGGPDPGCVSPMKADECAAMPGTTKFYPEEVCTGVLEDDCPLCMVNEDCDDGDECTDDVCNPDGTCSNTDNFDTVNLCCDTSDGTTCVRVDDDQCTDDVCELANSRGDCLHPPSQACTPCDDENPCTYDDHCDGLDPPGCAGLDVNEVCCTTASDCEAITGVAFDCLIGDCSVPDPEPNQWDGHCFCTIAPKLTPNVHWSDKPNGHCYLPGEKIVVDIFVGAAAGIIYGGQFVLEYDPACLSFNSISPGNGLIGNPYPFEIEEIVDEANGRIFYAVGVDPFWPVGTNGNAVLAIVSFTKVGVCTDCVLCFGGENPMNTYLVDNAGQPIFVEPECSKPIMENDAISLDCPGNEVVNVDCDKVTAEVYWDAPTASSTCYDVDLVCYGQHESGLDMTAMVMGGGEHPLGVTTYDCIATSTVCGDSETCRWTVTVNDLTTLDVEIQLSPIIAGDLLRCIKFELFSDCVMPPLVFEMDIWFGGLFDHIGHFTDEIKIPGSGQWKCITARDQLHTLRSCAWLECVDGVYYAIFKGDPFFGGNWLIGGNLDGFKKENPYASHDVIDILDFGMFVSQFLAQADPNTVCGTPGPNADINGDGIVDSLDFSFVMMNFLVSSKDCCCGPAAGTTVGRTEISVRELRALGLGDLAVGDLNRDGLLNMDDVNAFQAGDLKLKKAPRDRKGLK